ncbi:MAG: hypothetical protein RI885_1047 [Actinomycetota bacterium]
MNVDDGLVPASYGSILAELKQRVRNAQFQAQRRVNTELIQLYWSIGRTILDQQAIEGWGSGVVGRLAADLRAEFPAIKGFSRSNLMYMRAFAEAWPSPDAIVQQPVGQLPWGHITTLLDKFDNESARDW